MSTQYNSYQTTTNLGPCNSWVAIPASWVAIGQFTVDQNCTLTRIQLTLQDPPAGGAAYDLKIHGSDGTDYQVITNFNPFGGASSAQPSHAFAFPAKTGVSYSIEIQTNQTTYPDQVSVGAAGAFNADSNGIHWGTGQTYNGNMQYEMEVTWQYPTPSTPTITAPATNTDYAPGTTVTISWSASSPGQTGDVVTYTPQVSTDLGKTWTNIASGMTATSTTYTIPSGAATGTEYMFQVIANEGSGASATTATSSSVYIFADPSGMVTHFSTVVGLAYDTSGNGGRKLVCLSNGWLVAAAYYSGGGQIIFDISRDNGATWSQLCYTSINTNPSYAIASNGTTVYVFITVPAGTAPFSLKFDATTVTNTNISSGAIYLPSESSFGSGVSLAIDGTGALHAIWSSKNSTYSVCFNVRYGKSTDGGNTWTVTQFTTVNITNADQLAQSIVMRSNNTPVVFTLDSYSAGSEFRLYANPYNGGAWSTLNNSRGSLIIDNGSHNIANLTAAVDSQDNLCIGYQSLDATDTGYFNIHFGISSDSFTNCTWTLTKITSGNVYNQQRPSITIDDKDNRYLVWDGIDSTINTSYSQLRMVVYSGGSWGSVTSLTNNTTEHSTSPATLWSKFNMNCKFSAPVMIYSDSNGIFYRGTINLNQPPNAPSFFNISSNGSTINTKPKLFSNVSDPDAGNTIQNMEIQVSTVNTFATTVIDSQYGNDAGYGTQQAAAWSGLPTATNTNSNVTFTPQSALPTGNLYVRVRSKDNNNAWGAWSSTQQFTVATAPWSDTPVAGDPGMKAQWMNDLATIINNARQFRGLATFAFTDGTLAAQDANGNGTDIKATHINERRTKLKDVLNIVGVTWNPTALDNTMDRDGQHIIDLRSYCAQT